MKKWALGIVACLAMALALVPGVAMADDFCVPVGTYRDLNDNMTVGRSVKLTADITITDHLVVDGKTLFIDLNGHVIKYEGDTLSGSGGILQLKNGANVTLRDSDPTAEHKYKSYMCGLWKLDDSGDATVAGGALVGGIVRGGGGGVSIESGSTFNMEAGNIIGCEGYWSKAGGVFVNPGCTFNMSGGSIRGCWGYYEGGGVCVYGNGSNDADPGNAVFNMSGGLISNCLSQSNAGQGGGGVIVKTDAPDSTYPSYAIFNMTGGEISYCYGYDDSGSLSDWGIRVTSGSQFRMTGGKLQGMSVTDLEEKNVERGSYGVAYGAAIVTFSGVNADQQLLYGVAPTLPDTASPWYTDPTMTTEYDGSAITASTTLYAGGPYVSISYSDDALAGLASGASYTVAWHDEAGTYSLELTADEDGEIPVSGNDYDLYGKYIQVSDSTGTRYLSIPNKPEAEDLTDSDVTATTTSLTVAAKPGYLYSIDDGETCYMDDDGDGKVVFEGLDSYADYTVSYRTAYTSSSFASPVKTYAAKTLCAHDYTKATCVAKATCKICGETTGELDPENHTDLQHYDAKEATAEDWGNVEFWYCFGCQKYFKGAEATPDEEVDKSEVWIPKKTDGDSKKDEETPDKPKKDGKEIPQTGDSASAFALVGLAGVSALAVAFATKRH